MFVGAAFYGGAISFMKMLGDIEQLTRFGDYRVQPCQSGCFQRRLPLAHAQLVAPLLSASGASFPRVNIHRSLADILGSFTHLPWTRRRDQTFMDIVN